MLADWGHADMLEPALARAKFYFEPGNAPTKVMSQDLLNCFSGSHVGTANPNDQLMIFVLKMPKSCATGFATGFCNNLCDTFSKNVVKHNDFGHFCKPVARKYRKTHVFLQLFTKTSFFTLNRATGFPTGFGLVRQVFRQVLGS